MKLYVFIMHMKPVKKNKKEFGGGQKNVFRPKILDPKKSFGRKEKNQTLHVSNFNEIPPGVPKLQPIEIWDLMMTKNVIIAAGGRTGGAKSTKFWLIKLMDGVKLTTQSKKF